MKKLATILGGLICLRIMGQPKDIPPARTINNYFFKSSGGCKGGCGGHCDGSCGHHH